MLKKRAAAVLAGLALLVPVGTAGTAGTAGATPAYAAGGGDRPGRLAELLGRQALPPNDGWAADGPGTTGGLAAADV